MKMMDANEIISYIQNSEKKTPVKVYIKGDLEGIDFGPEVKTFLSDRTGVVFGDWKKLKPVLDFHKDRIEEMVVENDRNNSAIPLLDLKNIPARIEPGAIIREQVEIGKNAGDHDGRG